MDYFMHVLPGKIRIRTSVLRKNELEMDSMSQCVNAIQGVTSFKTNHSAGTVLICFDRNAISYHHILNKLAQGGLMPLVRWEGKKKSIKV